MSAALHLARPGDERVLLPMVAACHAEAGIEASEAHRARALAPLLDGSPHGCAYLIGPRKAPVGYVVVSFGWSLEFGGLTGCIEEFFVRRGVRGRGVGTEALGALVPELETAGLCALHLEAAANRPHLDRLCARAGFERRAGHHLMTRIARR